MTTDQGDHRPIPNSYWVIPGRLAAGEYPGGRRQGEASAKLRDLLDAGIDHFVDLTDTGELVPYGDIAELEARNMGIRISRARFPIYDGSIPQKPEDMTAILDNIDQAIAADHRVYVHCMGGIGRTGTVIGLLAGSPRPLRGPSPAAARRALERGGKIPPPTPHPGDRASSGSTSWNGTTTQPPTLPWNGTASGAA